jgi:hypothetical protein
MKTKLRVPTYFAMLYCVLTCAAATAASQQAREAAPPANPKIDMQGYLAVASQAADHRATHRLSEADFLRLSNEPGTVVLDARSREKYDLLHVKGAVNLNFSDITVAKLDELLPDKNTRILIYCNNNFVNNERAFPTKMATASLNLSTYIALYTYGYHNVYELAPLLDAGSTKLDLVASARR